MGSHASPDFWISAEKNPGSAQLRRTFCDVEFCRKYLFSRNPKEKPLNQQKPTTQNQKMSSAEPQV